VYVYCIVPNQVPSSVTVANVTFTMVRSSCRVYSSPSNLILLCVQDGHIVGSYVHIPDNATDIQYNVPVYVNTSLSDGPHTLSMATSGDVNSLILFDYAMYT
jgi:hypothetical protein